MTSLVDESSLLAALEATTRTLQERGKVVEASGTLEQTLALTAKLHGATSARSVRALRRYAKHANAAAMQQLATGSFTEARALLLRTRRTVGDFRARRAMAWATAHRKGKGKGKGKARQKPRESAAKARQRLR